MSSSQIQGGRTPVNASEADTSGVAWLIRHATDASRSSQQTVHSLRSDGAARCPMPDAADRRTSGTGARPGSRTGVEWRSPDPAGTEPRRADGRGRRTRHRPLPLMTFGGGHSTSGVSHVMRPLPSRKETVVAALVAATSSPCPSPPASPHGVRRLTHYWAKSVLVTTSPRHASQSNVRGRNAQVQNRCAGSTRGQSLRRRNIWDLAMIVSWPGARAP